MKSQSSILVVDDEPNNFDVIDTFIDEENYNLNYAPSGKEALELLEIFQPDVILLDVMMPNMSGIDVCKILKADPKWQHIPIIIITSLTSKEDLSNCLAAGADDFISKPVNSTELRARLQSMLRIKQQYDNVQELLQLREDMVNMILHDLRNPIASILLSTELLRRYASALPPEEQQQKLDEISMSTQQLRSLVDDLLLRGKLESGKLTLNRTDIDLYDLCESAIAGLTEIAAQKNLQLTLNLLKTDNRKINVDPSLFRRVIDNLLSNAIKFSPPNSQITLVADYVGERGARIQVADLGPGVKDSLRQSIFEKYEIGTLMKGINQIGLGLAFCKIVIEAHGGRIAVEDNAPRGSVFTIEIDSALEENN
ncbi:MAG: response regulator [Leptolyngbyaceae bacterium]|nr:response regulator [Leptolyngbyaceae bacterium]